MAGIGYALNRNKVNLQAEEIGKLVVLVGTPSLVFSTLTSPKMLHVPVSGTVVAASLTVVIAFALSAVFLRLIGQPQRPFVASVAMPNAGNMGLPLVLLAFGDEGLIIGVAFFFVIAVCQYTFVHMIVAGQMSFKRLLREPLIYSLAAVFFFRLTGIEPHPILIQTTKLLGGMMIPIMVILLGYSLAQLQVSDVRLSIVLAVARLIVGLLAGVLTIELLDLKGVAAGCIFLMAPMPSAMIVYLFAIRYNQAPRRVAGHIVASTLLTFACLPVLLWIGIGIAQGAEPWDAIRGYF